MKWRKPSRMLNNIRKAIYSLFKFLPLKKKIVFESRLDYIDNSKYLYEEFISSERNVNYDVYWFIDRKFKNKLSSSIEEAKIIYLFDDAFIADTFLKKTHKFIITIINEFKTSYHLNTTEFYFYSYRNYCRIKPKYGQHIVNLGHGISLKDTRGRYPDVHLSTHILTLSPFTKDLRSYSYGGGQDQMINLGFPRNDLLVNQVDNNPFSFDKFDHTIVWMPTFRRANNQNRNDSNASSKFDLPLFNSEKELVSFNQFLNKYNTLVILKPHPTQDLNYYPKTQHSNFYIIDNKSIQKKGVDLYSLLNVSDSIITDYSSVYIDYLLTDKPIAFTIDDYQNFSSGLGFIVDNPQNYMPGKFLKTEQELRTYILGLIDGHDEFKEERLKMKKIFHSNFDGDSSRRILDYFNL